MIDSTNAYVYYRDGFGAGSLGGAQQLTGGVVAEIVGLHKAARFSGGGVVADIFRDSSPETDPIRSRERCLPHNR